MDEHQSADLFFPITPFNYKQLNNNNQKNAAGYLLFKHDDI